MLKRNLLPLLTTSLMCTALVAACGDDDDSGNGGTQDAGNGGTQDTGNGGTQDTGNGGTQDTGNGGTPRCWRHDAAHGGHHR
jgi:hypothetical protein